MTRIATDLFTGVVPFVATAEARSFRGAARALGVTPSAVSKAVARLEAELGVRLLNRTSRVVTLTAEGEAVLARCRDAVDQVQAARELASQAQRAPRGVLRVSLPLPLGRLLVMPALPRLLARHPGLSVHAMLTDRFVQLAEENVDVVVRVGPVDDSRAVVRRLAQARWVTVAAPAYLARSGTPAAPADLARHNCLRFVVPAGRPREWVFRGEVTLAPPGNLVADHGESLIAAAVAGLGVVQALDFMVAPELLRGQLVEVLRDHAAEGPPISALCAPGRSGAPKVRAFVGFCAELFAPPPRGTARGVAVA